MLVLTEQGHHNLRLALEEPLEDRALVLHGSHHAEESLFVFWPEGGDFLCQFVIEGMGWGSGGGIGVVLLDFGGDGQHSTFVVPVAEVFFAEFS